MRITNNMILRAATDGLQASRSDIANLQAQVTSGVKIATASDDPTAAAQVMTASSSLTAVDQYKRNLGTASSRNTAEGGTLDQLTNILARAKELAVAQSTGTATVQSRQAAGAEMEQLFNTAVSLSGAKFGNEYLFGGSQVTQAPFTSTGTGSTLDFTTDTPTGTRSVAISAGQSLVATHNGQEVFANSGVLTSLRDAAVALNSGTQTSITNAIPSLDSSFDNVQVIIGENGARANALDTASQNLDALKANLTAYRSNLQDIDIESTVTALVAKQTTYQAAMSATAKVLGMSLTDYLK